MYARWDTRSIVWTAAVLSALVMLGLGIAGNAGIYGGAAAMMAEWHQFFDLTPLGILTGMVEGAFWGGLFAGLFSWLYNRFLTSREDRGGPR